MNQLASRGMVLPMDRVPVAPEVTNANEFESDLEKYEHLEELTELFFAAKRHHPLSQLPVHS